MAKDYLTGVSRPPLKTERKNYSHVNNDEEYPQKPRKVENHEQHRQALHRLVAAVTQDLPNSNEQFEALRHPTAYTVWRNSIVTRIIFIRKGGVALGDVHLIQHVHTLLREVESCEQTLEKLGPSLHIN